MPAFPLRRLLIGFRARYHLWIGRRAYRLGAFTDAGAHFHKAIEDGYPSFEAHLALGKIYLRQQDFRRAGIFFHRARNLDPGRFRLQGFPDGLVDQLQSESSGWRPGSRTPRSASPTWAPRATSGTARRTWPSPSRGPAPQ